jgi:hypothetical protein
MSSSASLGKLDEKKLPFVMAGEGENSSIHALLRAYDGPHATLSCQPFPPSLFLPFFRLSTGVKKSVITGTEHGSTTGAKTHFELSLHMTCDVVACPPSL